MSSILLWLACSVYVVARPTPTLAPIPNMRRNNVAVPSDATGLTITRSSTASFDRFAQSVSTTASPAETSSTVATGGWSQLAGGRIPSNFLTWIAIVIIGIILVSLLVARFYFIKRYYPPTFRAYFIPMRGIHFKYLGIHINGPPPRIPREAPPAYSLNRMDERRRRRRGQGRTTVGEGIAEGGVRNGERDQDDVMEGDEEPDALPKYSRDHTLPGYAQGDGGDVLTTEDITALGIPLHDTSRPHDAATGAASASQIDLPSVQAYEEATRQGTNLPAATNSATETTVPTPSADDTGLLRMIRPTLLSRLSGRSAAADRPTASGSQLENLPRLSHTAAQTETAPDDSSDKDEDSIINQTQGTEMVQRRN